MSLTTNLQESQKYTGTYIYTHQLLQREVIHLSLKADVVNSRVYLRKEAESMCQQHAVITATTATII